MGHTGVVFVLHACDLYGVRGCIYSYTILHTMHVLIHADASANTIYVDS